MNLYARRTFEENEEKKAKNFCYKHRGTWKYTQAMDAAGHVRMVYQVEYIPQEKKAKTGN